MRADLDHLPAAKQRELARVVELIFEEFEDELRASTQKWKKTARIRKIILYGSHARGNWVDEPHTAKGYRSDYDLLIIVSHHKLTDKAEYWYRIEERLLRELHITRTLKTPVSLIVHTLMDVNTALAEGRYFFMDIARDGVVLYEDTPTPLARPRPKTPDAALALAEEYYEEWLPGGMGWLDNSRYIISQGRLKQAAFGLHQATESLYHCALLVLTFYTPNSHNIADLRTRARKLDERLEAPWRDLTKREQGRFSKLKDAYVKARYSKHYRITAEELDWLLARIESLAAIVKTVCEERLAALRAQLPAK